MGLVCPALVLQARDQSVACCKTKKWKEEYLEKGEDEGKGG
jgi:hypothetical protein